MKIFCKDCKYLTEKKFDVDISCASDIYYVCAAPDWYGHEYGDIDHAAAALPDLLQEFVWTNDRPRPLGEG